MLVQNVLSNYVGFVREETFKHTALQSHTASNLFFFKSGRLDVFCAVLKTTQRRLIDNGLQPLSQ